MIKRAKRISKQKTRSELFVAVQQIKHGTDGLTRLFDELIDINLALQSENEQLRTALQNARREKLTLEE